MKLIIHTQHRENYGAHDWDGEGACPQYWKFKGGDTYVVRGLTQRQAERVNSSGIPTLKALIESRSDSFEEYVLGYDVVADDARECEDWDTVTEFQWAGDRWTCLRYTPNDEYGYMRKEILAKSEQWIPQLAGERAHYSVQYKLASGWFNSEDATRELQHAQA